MALRQMITEVRCNKCQVVFVPSDWEDIDAIGRFQHYGCMGFDTWIMGSWYQEVSETGSL